VAKNNISFYPHKVTSHNHWKFKTLRKKFGWAGEGRFWALCNAIGDCEGCMLDLNEEDKMLSVAADLDLTDEDLKQFIEFLVSKCKLIILVENNITTDTAQEALSTVNGRRSYQREWKNKKTDVQSNIEKGKSSIENTFSSIETEFSTIENGQSKEKKRKEKESKEGDEQIFSEIIQVAPSGIVPFVDRNRPDHAPTYMDVYSFFYAQNKQDEAVNFFNYYEGLGWKKGISNIVNWRSFANTWIASPITQRNEQVKADIPKQSISQYMEERARNAQKVKDEQAKRMGKI